ncbi:MAG: nickel transporter [Betaproteobacteria bacterium HGW-Betaproteobacteria-22]|nr:MAG: nickel transporter [Betaproteobacteria bacterium HGW-Betaproteobacteria-22]
MHIIPVIDLLNGEVVHAKQGNRQRYQSIQSQLTHSSKPLDVVAALLEYFPFKQLYIADLNAIQKLSHAPNNYTIIENITSDYPELELWVDAGIRSTIELGLWEKLNVRLILGSENFSDLSVYLAIKHQINSPFILSLDYMPNGYQGPLDLIKNTQHWPRDVILMSLNHVGAELGINIGLLETFKAHTSSYHLYAAGGVRNIDDLELLKKSGVHGALTATALHFKKLSHSQIECLTKHERACQQSWASQ